MWTRVNPGCACSDFLLPHAKDVRRESEPRYFGPAAVLTIRAIKQTVYFFLLPPPPPPLPEELCSGS